MARTGVLIARTGDKKKVFLMHELLKNLNKVCTTNSTQLYKKNGVHMARTGVHIARTGKRKKVFLMHELVKISNKVCTTNSTQLHKKKMMVTLHEQVFILHELDKNKKMVSARGLLVSARCLRGRACLGRGRTTKPCFALSRTSGSILMLFFRGAGEQHQSTRRRRGRRRGRTAAVPSQTKGRTASRRRLFPTNREAGRTAVRGRARVNCVVHTAVPTNRTRVRSRSSPLLIQ